jgi:hypothetical protein
VVHRAASNLSRNVYANLDQKPQIVARLAA